MFTIVSVLIFIFSASAHAAERLPHAQALTKAEKITIATRMIKAHRLEPLRKFLEFPENSHLVLPENLQAVMGFGTWFPFVGSAAVFGLMGHPMATGYLPESAQDLRSIIGCATIITMGFKYMVHRDIQSEARRLVDRHEHNCRVHAKHMAKELAEPAARAGRKRMRRKEIESTLLGIPIPLVGLINEYDN